MTEILIPAWRDGTLVPVEKLEAHRLGLKHLAVSVFVTCGPDVLLQRRALSKYHTPGLWTNTCCTHPAWREPSEDCATRRLDEELGITGLDLTFRERVEYRAEVGGGLTEHEVVDIFTAEAPRDLGITPDPDEVSDTRWMPREALIRDVASRQSLYTPWLRIYLEKHSEMIFGTTPAAT